MSRDINDLIPEVKEKALKLIEAAQAAGMAVLVIDTDRTYEEQDILYAQGRTKPGHIVTHARGGYSNHNFRRAFDIVPLNNGKVWWNAPRQVWEELGQIGKNCGLEWGGDWAGTSLIDLDHFQDMGGMTLAQLREIHDKTKGRML